MAIKVKGSSTKEDEIMFLELVRSEIAKETYLDSLFSKGLIEWFTNRVKVDLSCDLFGEYCKSSEDWVKLNGMVQDANQVAGRLAKDFDKARVSWALTADQYQTRVTDLERQRGTRQGDLRQRRITTPCFSETAGRQASYSMHVGALV